MKTILIIVITIFLQTTIALSQNAKYQVLASFGGTFTKTKTIGSNPFIFNQKETTFSTLFDLQLIHQPKNKKGGLWFNFAYADAPLKVKYSLDSNMGRGLSKSGNDYNRVGIGYLVKLKKIFFNQLFENAKNTKGAFVQLEPKVALNLSRFRGEGKGSSGSIGANRSAMVEIYHYNQNIYGITYGSNLYFGKNERTYFFITITNNINLATSVSNGLFTVINNGVTTKTKVYNNGNGLNLSAGVKLLSFGKY